jgi:hypothetical protein
MVDLTVQNSSICLSEYVSMLVCSTVRWSNKGEPSTPHKANGKEFQNSSIANRNGPEF